MEGGGMQGRSGERFHVEGDSAVYVVACGRRRRRRQRVRRTNSVLRRE